MNEATTRRVVLVHGLWFREVWMRVLARRLRRAGFTPLGFNYSSTRRSLADSAGRLQALCDSECAAGAHLVGHSLGGLLILQMLAEDRWRGPGRILFLGTPLTGSAVARRAVNWPGASLLLGQAADPLVRGSAVWPRNRDTAMIAGTRPIGLGLISGGLAAPHDGTVSVTETRHPGLATRLEMPVTHTGLIYSAPVARQVAAFLGRGKFDTARGRA